MQKIKEIILEPDKIKVGSSFRLKIRAINYLSYNELKNKNYNYFKDYKYKELKGV